MYMFPMTNNRVQIFTPDGAYVTKWGTRYNGLFNDPAGVAVDSSDYVYIADNCNNRIQVFTDTGTYVTQWGHQGTGIGEFTVPYGIAIDSSNNVYIADSNNDRIQKFTLTRPPEASFNTFFPLVLIVPPPPWRDVGFIDTSSNTPTAWNWSFTNVTGNNTQVWFSTAQNPNHTFGVGNFSIVLNASNSAGYNLSTQVTFINVTGGAVVKGNDGIAIFRNSSGYWYFDHNLDGIINKSFRYGGIGDQIVKGDWDGDGKDGIAIFRPSTGYWYFDYNLDGVVDKFFRYGGSD